MAVPVLPVIEHGPENAKLTVNAPADVAVLAPVPCTQATVIDAFAIAAPTAAVPLILPEAVVEVVTGPPPPLSPPPPQAVIRAIATTPGPIHCAARSFVTPVFIVVLRVLVNRRADHGRCETSG
ncbi:hypothetical protein BGC_08910 [Burkholderia sp. 3C]